MNDHSPRRYRGSLLERAAQLQQVPPIVPRPSAPVHAPIPPMPAFEPEGPLLRRPAGEAPLELTTPAPAESDDWVPEPELSTDAAVEPTTEAAPRADGPARIDRDLLEAEGMLIPDGPITPLAEEFRMVKRQLLLTARSIAAADDALAADRARMILVCSAHSGEGKTFCAVNLALSMAAERDVEILLVDADFGKPDVLARLGIPAGPGLLDALSGKVADVEDCIVATDVPQLSVLPAGTRSNSDTEMLASDRARALLDRLAAANPRRIVIFDSPPALAASPASVLALHVGQAMLVVRADRTSESDLRETVSTLGGCEHIQLVLNSVSFQPGGRRFGSYYEESPQ